MSTTLQKSTCLVSFPKQKCTDLFFRKEHSDSSWLRTNAPRVAVFSVVTGWTRWFHLLVRRGPFPVRYFLNKTLLQRLIGRSENANFSLHMLTSQITWYNTLRLFLLNYVSRSVFVSQTPQNVKNGIQGSLLHFKLPLPIDNVLGRVWLAVEYCENY